MSADADLIAALVEFSTSVRHFALLLEERVSAIETELSRISSFSPVMPGKEYLDYLERIRDAT